jgi:hypothetical protein
MSGADILHAIRVERVWTLGQCVGRLLEVPGEDVLDGMAREIESDFLVVRGWLVSGRWVDCRADVERLPDDVLVTIAERLEQWHGAIARELRRAALGLEPLHVSDEEVEL